MNFGNPERRICFISAESMIYTFPEESVTAMSQQTPTSQNPHNNEPSRPREDRQSGVMLKARPETRQPSLYKVLLLNDDFTPMEFVVHVLERFFHKTADEATEIMLHVHRRGVGLCGIYTFEVAETKVSQVMDFSRANEQPLQCTMEKE